jgi:hypothetical protein
VYYYVSKIATATAATTTATTTTIATATATATTTAATVTATAFPSVGGVIADIDRLGSASIITTTVDDRELKEKKNHTGGENRTTASRSVKCDCTNYAAAESLAHCRAWFGNDIADIVDDIAAAGDTGLLLRAKRAVSSESFHGFCVLVSLGHQDKAGLTMKLNLRDLLDTLMPVNTSSFVTPSRQLWF